MAFFGLLGGDAAASDAAIEAAALRSDRFRQEREGDWKRLEAIVTRMEAGRWRRLSDEDVLALPVLYRTVASSLSVARETSLDSATLAYLEALVQRAWFLVYGPRTTLAGWLARFLGGEWSRAVRAIWPELLVAFAVMAAGTLVGWLLVSSDPDWYYALVPGQFQDARVPGATREVLQGTLFGSAQDDGLSMFAAYLFSHNAPRRWGRWCGCTMTRGWRPTSSAGFRSTARPSCWRSCWRGRRGCMWAGRWPFPARAG